MGQRDERISHQMAPPTDRWIAGIMVEHIGARCMYWVSEENRRLTEDLILFDDAIMFGGIDKWRWVGSVIEDLTDKTEVDKLMEGLSPKSKLHDYVAVASIVNCLSHWRREEVISEHDTMLKAIDILTARLVENMHLLGSIP